MPHDLQPPVTDDSNAALLIAMLEDDTRNWRGDLDAVPDEAIYWQPYPDSHSIGAILLHIADAEAYWLHQVLTGVPLSEETKQLLMSDEVEQFAGKWGTPPKQPLAWYYEQQDKVRKQTLENLKAHSDPSALYGERQFTLRWLLHHVITHEAYHAGQVSLLLSQYRALNSL